MIARALRNASALIAVVALAYYLQHITVVVRVAHAHINCVNRNSHLCTLCFCVY